MTFKAIVRCDDPGCCEEVELECWDAADAEDAVFDLDSNSEWFVNYSECNHYCPEHAQSAKAEYEKENVPVTGIYPTMVG
ncbi:TPA: hypothetical protein RUZ16_000906 [Vibrio cholerae]|nr:hypothetical protein [Vibrio cholerae]